MRAAWMTLLVALVTVSGCLDESNPAPANDAAPSEPWYTGEVGEWNRTEPFTKFGEIFSLELPRSGEGIWIEEGILVHTNGAELHIVDARDPTNLTLIGHVPDLAGARDVDLLDWNGTKYALVAGSGNGMYVIDLSDPANPIHISTATPVQMSPHNLAAVDGTPYIYVSGGGPLTAVVPAVGAPVLEIVDITDPFLPISHIVPMPRAPGPVDLATSNGCHDITVRVDLERAYCAGGGSLYQLGGGETFIWDIADPLAPQAISMIDDPRIVYHHQVFPDDDGDILIINDEYIGAYQLPVANGANNCIVNPDTPLPDNLDSGVPMAAAWIYDISDEANPVQLSYVQNPSGWNGDGVPPNPLEGNCGAHFGDMIPGHDAFIMAWYEGGTILVDYSDPTDPQVMDIAPQVGGETWDSMYYDGYVFHASGDLFATELI